MSISRPQSDLLLRMQALCAREARVRACLLRLRAIGERAQHIDRASSDAWNEIIAEKQVVIDELSSLGGPTSEEDAAALAAGAAASSPRVQAEAARARQTADGNITLLAEVVALEARLERRLAGQIRALAEQMGRPFHSRRVRGAYRPRSSDTPRFLDRRK